MLEIKGNVFTSSDGKRTLDVLVDQAKEMPHKCLVQTSYVMHLEDQSIFIPEDVAEYIARNWGTTNNV